MKYSKSDSAYFRKSKKENSIKGGKLRENGKLENSDFSGKNGNNVGKYKQRNVVKPIKIMKQKITDEPFFFFAYNPETETYHLVCYNNSKAKHGIEFKKLVIHKNGSSEIVKLSHREFLDIDIEELIVLCYHFLKIRQKNHGFMNKLYKYLSTFVFEKVLGTRFPPNSNNHKMHRNMVKEIEKMVMEEGHRMLNKRGGKLDEDGKLDSRDFMLYSRMKNSIKSTPEIVQGNTTTTGVELQEMINNNQNPSLPQIIRTTFSATVRPKEIIKKGLFPTGEPYIFFGYDPRIKRYRFVCYNRNPFSKTPVFRRLEDNGHISLELTLEEIKQIDIIEIAKLFCFLNDKNSNGYKHMSRLQDFILDTFRSLIPLSSKKIEEIKNNSLKNSIQQCFNIVQPQSNQNK